MRKVTEYIAGQMSQEYAQGLSTEVISQHFGVSRQTVTNNLIALGWTMRTSAGTTAIENREQLARDYEGGQTADKVAKKHNVHLQSVLNAARVFGVSIRPNQGGQKTRKHFFNQDFFSTWTPDMAYILGFFMADGSVDNHGIRFYQKEPDILYKIAECIGYTGGYSMAGTNRTIYSLILSSTNMLADIEALGVHPKNKSLRGCLPNTVYYPADLVRGYFDGDGHGGYYPLLRIGFTSGSIRLLQDIMDILPTPIGGPYKGKGNSLSIQTTSQFDAFALRDWMYSGQSSLYIQRKKDKLY